MKKYFLLFAVIGFSTTAFSLTLEDTFNATFKIDSVTVGKSQSTINLSSPSTGQYGKVYVSYTFTSNPDIPGSGTWTGHGRGISPEGVIARGDLMGVYTLEGGKIHVKSLDSVTDGINFLEGSIDLVSGVMEASVSKVK